jgi:hypothetical protein
MDATPLIAGFAAVVATGGLAWQVYAWRHRRQVHVDIQVRYGIVVPLNEAVHIISIEARNRGEHVVRVTSVGLDLQDGSGSTFQQLQRFNFATLPGTIEPFDSATAFIEVSEAEAAGIDVYEPITARVWLATGEVVKSPPTPIRSRD